MDDLLVRIGITPDLFQAFAAENRKVGAKYHRRIVRFEDSIAYLDLGKADPRVTTQDDKAEFVDALNGVIHAFRAWREEGGYGRHTH
jgi:hypothetical protein